MKIIDITNEKIKEDIVLALGYFDGVHLGHKVVLEQAIHISKNKKIKSAVFTFKNSPKNFIENREENHILSYDFKLKKLEEIGFDYVLVLPFDELISKINYNDFVINYISSNCVKHIVCGYDYKFGYKGLGNTRKLSTYDHFDLTIIDEYLLNKVRVSSSYIKNNIRSGNIELANKLLGYNFTIIGKVIKGKQRGKNLVGFATANIEYTQYILPQNGVYAVKVKVDDIIYKGMANIGYNPTFGDINKPSLEVHIFDFDKEIYGEILEVSFNKKVRNECKFDNIEQLKSQLKKDHIEILNSFEKEA